MKYLAKSDVVTAALRELLITGEIAPGTELRQRELADRFDVSPTPIREALKRLESEGLVLYDVHRGARVIDTDLTAGTENFIIRASLEGLATALAARRITEAELLELGTVNEQLAAHGIRDAHADELNRRFHFMLFEIAGSPLLQSLLRLLWHSFQRASFINRPLELSVAQHREILDALRRRDSAAAETLTRAHVLHGRDDVNEHVLPPLLATATAVIRGRTDTDDTSA